MKYFSKRTILTTENNYGLNFFLSVRSCFTKFIVGCCLVSVGIFVSATGGSWDITNHLLNRPETFFSPPHALLYSGVGVAIFGSVIVYKGSRYLSNFESMLKLSAKLIFVGISMLIVAGPIDFAWHSSFGLDGLLSPPHIVLLSGMIVCSVGAMMGSIFYVAVEKTYNDKSKVDTTHFTKLRTRQLRASMILSIVIGFLPIWMTLSGLISMLSLPFSKTQYFNFNPDPVTAAILASVAYPFIISFLLCCSFFLVKKFGVISIIGACYLTINVITVIMPNESLIPTIPFYSLNILPILASDILLSFSNNKSYSVLLSGAILASCFFMVQYPLITHVYNEVFTKEAFVWPSLTSSIYFGMITKIYPYLIAPAFSMGIVGATIASKITNSHRLTRDQAISETPRRTTTTTDGQTTP
jgi:hypothetical protein